MVTRRTTALRRFGTLGVAVIVAVASLMLGAVPASAAGQTHYENVGNPGWCLDSNEIDVYLHRCGHEPGGADYQLWNYTQDSVDLQLWHNESGKCLVAKTPSWVTLGDCTESESHWDAKGKNGWVMLWNRTYGKCLIPFGTGAPGETYPLVLVNCNPGNLDNVPNLLAWRYFA